ncbi:hypothetical protein O181_077180 [Austropuccinia psidii MF-1]|uniref:Tet-like 2OG-Fe(II) oxygenase domain-containing protein n=1 Tax=Austropuccinia psidii MF-1 TaxID=1389203 RepID=A0A9Q3FA88_9BASI|nr:hypothetical protein [Austropuccinia psidii MF-1]
MTPSVIWRVVDVTKIKCIHVGHVEIFSSTGLLITLVEFRPFKKMSAVEVKQWDELPKFLFFGRKFTDPVEANGELMEGFIFAIAWCKCSTKDNQFGIYGSLGRIEDAKDEWQKRDSNPSLVGCILGQSSQYVGDKFVPNIPTCYKSLGVPSFDQVKYEANISAIKGEFEFASALTFTMKGFNNSSIVDRDAFLYALGTEFKPDKRTGQIQRDVSKQCIGGKLIFPNEQFWIDLSKNHGLSQLKWASSTFYHYNDAAQDNEITNLVGISAQFSRRLAPTMWLKSHTYYEMGMGVGYCIRDGNTISSQLEE